ncbi:hypothetical protein M0802_005760, partial [Mischocyttarus mexicanus]
LNVLERACTYTHIHIHTHIRFESSFTVRSHLSLAWTNHDSNPFPSLSLLQTALHWAAKHGDENIVKMIAGTYREYVKDVNITTGYTPLHIAMQFDHENVFNLLVQVYGANQEIRDYSGKKARQYLVSQEAAVSQDTFRRITAAATLRQVQKHTSASIVKRFCRKIHFTARKKIKARKKHAEEEDKIILRFNHFIIMSVFV